MISNWLLVKVSAFSGALPRAEHAWRNLPIGGVYDPCFPCWVRYIFEMVSARQRGGHQNDQNGEGDVSIYPLVEDYGSCGGIDNHPCALDEACADCVSNNLICARGNEW